MIKLKIVCIYLYFFLFVESDSSLEIICTFYASLSTAETPGLLLHMINDPKIQ